MSDKPKRIGRCDHHTAEFVGKGVYLPRARCDFPAIKRLRICKQGKDGSPIFADMKLCDFHANTVWYHKNVGWTIVGEFVKPPKRARKATHSETKGGGG